MGLVHFQRFLGWFVEDGQDFPPPAGGTRGAEQPVSRQDMWEFCKTLFFFTFIRYNRGHVRIKFSRAASRFAEKPMRRVFCLKRISKLLCLACAGALVSSSWGGCSFFQKDGADANAESGVSIYGKVSDFDYQNFDYTQAWTRTATGSGVKALDHVKLPEARSGRIAGAQSRGAAYQ